METHRLLCGRWRGWQTAHVPIWNPGKLYRTELSFLPCWKNLCRCFPSRIFCYRRNLSRCNKTPIAIIRQRHAGSQLYRARKYFRLGRGESAEHGRYYPNDIPTSSSMDNSYLWLYPFRRYPDFRRRAGIPECQRRGYCFAHHFPGGICCAEFYFKPGFPSSYLFPPWR